MKKAAACILLAAMATAVSAGDGDVFTLYRNSLTDANMRVHIATFDTDSKGTYNRENCKLAASLFQQQPGVKTVFWCESGRYRPY